MSVTPEADQELHEREAAARRYRPSRIRVLLVAETPADDPARSFYGARMGRPDPLYRAVVRAVLGEEPTRENKSELLERLAERGVFLIELKPDPRDRSKLADHVPALVRRCRELAPERIVLIKADVYDTAYRALVDAGLPVANERIPFPSSGQQRKFAGGFARALGQAAGTPAPAPTPRATPPRAARPPSPAREPQPAADAERSDDSALTVSGTQPMPPAPRIARAASAAAEAVAALRSGRAATESDPTATSKPGAEPAATAATVTPPATTVPVSLPKTAAAPSPKPVPTPRPASRPAPAPAPPPARVEARLDHKDLARIIRGDHGAPFDVLGPHLVDSGSGPALAVRAFLPRAESVEVRHGGSSSPMTRVHEAGFFEALLPGAARDLAYQLVVTWPGGATATIEDPYRFGPALSDYDLHLFGEGTHLRLWEKLGAQLVVRDGVAGVNFAVWAPNATRVSVIGDFNRWDERAHPMRAREGGVWELFLPGLGQGRIYKYSIQTRLSGRTTEKADPYGFFMERRPQTASVVWDLSRYRWNDAAWMESRSQRQRLDGPISIYEVHAGSWRRGEDGRWLTWRELAEQLIPYAVGLGYTHLELMPVSEHPFDGSWGYQTVGYYAPTSRFGTPDDFRAFMDAAHQAGLGVILDWVPAHFPKDGHGLGFFDGTHLYEHADPRRGEHMDWGTLIFNFSRPQVSGFLLSNALYWLEQFHVDGLRVDAVAAMIYLDYSRKPGEWVPNQFGGRENLEAVAFLKRFNEVVHDRFPDTLTFAEESTAWPMVSRPVYLGGMGFDIKWNMGWMHDMLSYMGLDPVFRRGDHNKLTFSLMYAFSEQFLLPLSHDEVVHGKAAMIAKMAGDPWKKFANLRALYGYMTGHPGKMLQFMGGELGQWKEWNHDAELDWPLLEFPLHQGLQRWVRDLNALYRSQPALHEVDFSSDGFQWIDFRDVDQSIVSFFRKAKDPDDVVVMVANFTPIPRHEYRVGVPRAGVWREALNSDATAYGGSGLGNGGEIVAEPLEWHTLPQSVVLTLPPLAVTFLVPAERKSSTR